MVRMRSKLREEYPDLNVCAPQNCQTVALRVPPDCSADLIGKLAEEVNNAKRGKTTEVSGLLVEDISGSRTLLDPEELTTYTTLSACKLQQCQRFTFTHSLAALGRALRETYDEVTVSDSCLLVCDCVRVSLEQQILNITWDTFPVADLVADSVAITAIDMARLPVAVQLQQQQQDQEASEHAREVRLFRVMCTYLQQEFGPLTLDEDKQTVGFQMDGNKVAVDFPARAVTCDSEALRERVRLCLRR